MPCRTWSAISSGRGRAQASRLPSAARSSGWRACQVVECRAGLDSNVIETRFNVVRSSVPDLVDTARRLRDYLPHVDQGSTPARGEVSLDEAAMTVGVWSRAGRALAASFPPR